MDYTQLEDNELREIRDTCMSILFSRTNEIIFAKSVTHKIISQYFSNDIRKLAFISETNFRKYKGINDCAVELVKKEMAKYEIKFSNE